MIYPLTPPETQQRNQPLADADGPSTPPRPQRRPQPNENATILDDDDIGLGGDSVDDSHWIAHSPLRMRDLEKLSWGVQWEICRLFSKGELRWEDVGKEALSQLEGTDAAQALHVGSVLLKPDARKTDLLHPAEARAKVGS